MLERDAYQTPNLPSGLEEIQTAREITWAEQKANWILPIAGMLEHDVLSVFVTRPKDVTGVFIGPWTRGFVEANAFRIACIRLGIEPQTVFLIDINSSVIDESTDKMEREQIYNALSANEETKHFMDTNVVKLGDDDFSVYTSSDFIDEVNNRQGLKLPPIVLIKGDAGNPNLAQAVTQVSRQCASLLVIGRNVDPIPFSYRQVVETWGMQVSLKNKQVKPSFLVFTVTDPVLAENMYGYITNAISGSSSDYNDSNPRLHKQSINSAGLQIFTPRSGLLLSFRPNLDDKGAHFSDNYIHIIGEQLNG